MMEHTPIGITTLVKAVDWKGHPVEIGQASYGQLTVDRDKVITSALDPTQLLPGTSRANDVQIGGNHYKKKAIQPWDYISSNDLDYFQGNIVKYVTRWKDKDGLKDLEKASHYLQKYIEEQRAKGAK